MPNTDVRISAKETGFSQVIQAITKLVGTSQKAVAESVKGFSALEEKAAKFVKTSKDQNKALSTKDARREMKDLEGQMRSLASQQVALNRAMRGVEEGTKEYKALDSQLEKVNSRYEKAATQVKTLNSAFTGLKKVMAGGAFTQGLMQGSGVSSEFLQRGPGMGRQVAGQAIGRAGRAGAGMFSGVGGMAQALSGIPVVGAGLAGQLSTTAGFVGQSLGYKKQMMDLAPFLGTGGAEGRISRAGRRGTRGAVTPEQEKARIQAAGSGVSTIFEQTPEMDAQIQKRTADFLAHGVEEALKSPRWAESVAKNEISTRKVVTAEVTQKYGESYRKAAEEEVLGGEARKPIAAAKDAERAAIAGERQAAGAKARARERNKIFGGVAGAGLNLLGVGKQEAMQTAAGITQAGGGGLEDLKQQGMLKTAFAAKRVFGVQESTAGAFQLAGRRGAAAGALGQGGAEMEGALQDAMKLGLEGSEINTYLQQMASGIMQWQNTGIPFNRRSMNDMAESFVSKNMDATRATQLAGGVKGLAERMSRGGPSDAADLEIFQQLTGFKGGSAEDFEKALADLESGNYDPEGFERAMANLQEAGGGGATGRIGAVDIMRSRGLEVSRSEAMAGKIPGVSGDPTAVAQSEKDAQAERDRIAKGGARADRLQGEGLFTEAGGSVSPAVKRQAMIQDQQLKIGDKMTTTVQNMEEAAKTINTAFADAAGPLEKASEKIAELAKLAGPAVDALQRLVAMGT